MIKNDKHNDAVYRSYVETMSEGFMVVDNTMKIVYINERLCQMLGYQKEELIGMKAVNLFGRENRPIINEQFSKRRQGESAPYQVEYRCKGRQGLFAMISPRPIFDSDGRFQGSSKIIIDITPYRQTEAMLLASQQALQQQIEATVNQKNQLVQEVESYHHALKVLLTNSQEEKKQLEDNLIINIREIIFPLLQRLKNTPLSDTQQQLLDAVEAALKDVVSPFISRITASMRRFTPMEIEIVHLIKKGKSIKEIAGTLAISEHTVIFHRNNIRKKLGLVHQKINLKTYLDSFN